MITIIDYIQKNTLLSQQEAWWMLEHITKKTRALLLQTSKLSLSKQEQFIIDDWIEQLSQKSIPLSYLLGSVPFLDLTIKVQPPILIPRQETEEWVANLIQELQLYKKNIKSILEIGTGSGCIALAIAKSFPSATITASDINPKALNLAKENASLNNVNNAIFVASDLFDCIKDQSFDLIISNPPYIDPIHKKTIMPQVLEWEDHQALFAKENGLALVYKIIEQAKGHLQYQPELPYQLVLEHDCNQQDQIKAHAQKNNFTCVNKKDLFGNFRTSWCKIVK